MLARPRIDSVYPQPRVRKCNMTPSASEKRRGKGLPELPSRQVHLDFHTGPAITDVGADFDAADFARTLLDARVDSVTLFAKCHHGLLYYDTARAERHPGLKPGLDLLGEQIEACRKVGIKTPIYLSVLCDEYAANAHPEWVCLSPEGQRVGRGPLASDFAGWQILDMSSPYADFLAGQIEEVVRRYSPVDGIFLDMCWDQPSVSKWAKAGMTEAGLNPANEQDRLKYANEVTRRYIERYNALITRANGRVRPRIWYNSRPKTQLVHEARYLSHIEIEALPTGGWGYTYFPLNVRWARNFGLPCIGMTARFHKSWSDFGGYKPPAALKYEVAQMLAHGTGCSIGDQLHPRGILDKEAYRRIQQAYAHVESIEKWCRRATPVTEVAVLRDPTGGYHVAPGDALEGIVRLLQQLFVQFDFVPPNAELGKYRLVIVPDKVSAAGDTGINLERFAAAGGKFILAGPEAIASASAKLRKLTGVAEISPPTPGLRTVYFRYDRSLIPDAEQSDTVCYDGSNRLRATAAAVMPAQIVEPYFERAWDHFSGHGQTPPATLTSMGPLVVSKRGAALGFDLFKAYAVHGQSHLRRLLAFAIDRLMPDPLIRSDIPDHAEITITRLGKYQIVHVLSYAPQRRTPSLDIVEDATPLLHRKLGLKLPNPAIRATREPAGEVLKVEYDGGYATVSFTSENGHDLIVFS